VRAAFLRYASIITHCADKARVAAVDFIGECGLSNGIGLGRHHQSANLNSQVGEL
jgi:hypothetical protein